MRRIRIKCHYCGEYGSFISEERVEVIPEVNLTMTDMNSLNVLLECWPQMAILKWPTFCIISSLKQPKS